MSPLIFLAALELSALPGVHYSQWDWNTVDLDVMNPAGMVTMEAEARIQIGARVFLAVGGEMQVIAQPVSVTVWAPTTLYSTIRARGRLGPLEIGIEHTCTHPVVPWAADIRRIWEGAATRVYLRVATPGW